MPPRAGCTASASRWSTRCPRKPLSKWRVTRRCTDRLSRGARRGRGWKIWAARPTGAAPRSASCPMSKFSARARPSSPSGCSRSRGRRRFSMRASKSAGNARPRSLPKTCPRRRYFSFPAACPIILPSNYRDVSAPPRSFSRASRILPMAKAAWNGRSPGRSGPKARSTGIATPSRPMPAARTSRGCARR